jgi:hypothetical protein
MQCSCCREQRDSLREVSISALDANKRKTILTLQLCAMCRILYRIKPQLVATRVAQAALNETRRVA